jgi:hypothetical protein
MITVLVESSTVMSSNIRYWGIASPYVLDLQKQKQTWWSERIGIQKKYFERVNAIFPSTDNTIEALNVLSEYLVWKTKGQ